MSGFDNDVMFSKNADFTSADNQSVSESNGLVTNGKMWIGSTATNAGGTHINVGSITSPDSSLTIGYSSPNITMTVTGGITVGKTITGNTGGALSPTAGNWNIVTANSTVFVAGSSSTLTMDFARTSNLVMGSSPTLSANDNTSYGVNAFSSATSAGNTSAFGFDCLNKVTSGSANSGFGLNSLRNITTPDFNSAFGANTLNNLLTGTRNSAFGYLAGNAYVGAESSNLLLSHIGVAGESNVTRIGTQGTGTGQQSQCYLAGVLNTTSGRVVNVTTPGAYPYTTLTTDYVILVDTSSARTITPLASPVTGTTYRIKDNVGSAAVNNITITPSGKNIDGAASYVINVAYGSVDIVYNGTQWVIL